MFGYCWESDMGLSPARDMTSSHHPLPRRDLVRRVREHGDHMLQAGAALLSNIINKIRVVLSCFICYASFKLHCIL